LFVFNGRVRLVQTTLSIDDQLHHGAYHDPDWRLLDWRRVSPSRPELCPRPERLDEMIGLAERLGQGFDHLRVDFYDSHDVIWIGELTVYSFSGFGAFPARSGRRTGRILLDD